MAVKKNKDGLEGGKLIDPATHAKILREKNKAKAKAAATKAAKVETTEPQE
jgi:hypothetical protein